MFLNFLTLIAIPALSTAYSLPQNLQTLYNNHRAVQCNHILASGFSPGSLSDKSFAYCGDVNGVIFLHSQNNGGEYADMDVDCDGANNSAGDCANDPSGQGQTAFQDVVQSYNVGLEDLDANIHPFVVFGNSGSSPSFDPQAYGIEPLSIMAVICNGQLHYGIWGDTNGGIFVGESSISLAKLCFPNGGITGDNGHEGKDVLYLAFQGTKAVPGAHGANWQASSASAFEDSIKNLGDSLTANL